jgi:tripartite-type tricarboxylate transporter receptor subunit TctC
MPAGVTPKTQPAWETAMKFPRRKLLHFAVGAAALPLLPRAARAQAFPSRPITMIVPASAGGPTDTIGRILLERMQASLGQSVVVENVAGAGGTIATGRVARATPDGYTICIGGWNHFVVNGAAYPLTYDLLNDFQAIAMVASGPQLILSRKDIPAGNLQELIAWLKANGDKTTAGTGGLASPPHISGLSFESMTGTRLQFVPYRGANPAMQDLVAGHIDVMLDQASSALSQVLSGSIKAYAVTAKTRLPSAPNIPTVDEAGFCRQDRCRGCCRLGRSGRSEAIGRDRPGDSRARAANAGRLFRLPEGRDREVVAGDQGRQYQDRIAKACWSEIRSD